MSDLGEKIKGETERRGATTEAHASDFHETTVSERITSGAFDEIGDGNNSDETKDGK